MIILIYLILFINHYLSNLGRLSPDRVVILGQSASKFMDFRLYFFSSTPVSKGPPDIVGDTDGWSLPGSLLKPHIVHQKDEIVDASVRGRQLTGQ